MSKDEILELLWEAPRSVGELVQLTGRSRQAVCKVLKKLREEGAVAKEEGKRGRYFLTPAGLNEYFDRRTNRLVYDYYILPKFHFSGHNFHDILRALRSFFDLRNLPAPMSYRAKLYVSEDLEREYQDWRASVSYREGVGVKPEDTLRELTSEFVNQIVWSILFERIAAYVSSKRPLDEMESFNIRLSLDISFKPDRNVLRRAAALLALWAVECYYGVSDVALFDMIRYLEAADESLKGLADLAEKASITTIKKEEEKHGDLISITTAIHRKKKKDDPERLKAVKALVERVIEILRTEGQVDRKSYVALKEALKTINV